MFACIMIRGARVAPQKYADAQTLLDALKPYDQDDVQGSWSNENMLMVQALTWNTPESRHEKAPETCKNTGRVIVSWCRLDNRADLCAQLGLTEHPTLTDPQIILESHRKWGADCADRLEGDFSFVIYDPTTEQTFCARDSIGAKPFFYYLDKEVFIAASTAAIFRKLENFNLTPSDDWMVRFLMSLPHVVTNSAYENVARLAPAHSLSVARNNAPEPFEYFTFKDTAPSADTRDPKYVDAYREAFHNAVEKRLRSDFLIGAENSGGLDSVSIMGHAVKHLPHDIEDFHCFGLPKQENDQDVIIKASLHAKVHHTHLATQMKGRADPVNFDRAIKMLGHPVEHSQINVHMAALRQCEAFGIRSMFSGYGGDEIVTHQASALELELFAKHQFRTLVRELPGNVLTKRLRFLKRLRTLGSSNAYNTRFSNILDICQKTSPVSQEVAEDLGILDEQRTLVAHAGNAKTLNDRILRHQAFSQARVGRLEACAVMALSHRVEYRWPLYDRQLIKCYLQTPAIEKRKKAMGRYLHRRAVVGSIPDDITWQRHKDTSNMVASAFSTTRPDIKDESNVPPRLASLLNFEKLDQIQTDVLANDNANPNDKFLPIKRKALWATIALTRWLEA